MKGGVRVARCPKTRRLQPVNTDLLARGERVGEGQVFVLGIEPGPGHQTLRRTGSRTDLFGEFGEAP